jgi:hypothetical protein
LALLISAVYVRFAFLASEDFKIIRLPNLLTLSVPEAGYSQNNSCALNVFIQHELIRKNINVKGIKLDYALEFILSSKRVSVQHKLNKIII